jgi:hypothetical protein
LPTTPTLLTEFIPELGKWTNWPLIFPETTEQPGIGGPLPMWAVIKKGIALTLEMLLGSPYAKNESPLIRWILDHFFPDYKTHAAPGHSENLGCLPKLLKPFAGLIAGEVKKEFSDIVEALRQEENPEAGNAHKKHNLILSIIEKHVKRIEEKGLPYAQGETPARHIALGICFAYYNLKGVLTDIYDPQTQQFDFDKINKYDYRAWLGMQGAPQWLIDSVIVRFFYTGTFANLVNENGGAVAAGTALQFFAKSVGYKGSFVYQMVYGTGEVMVMPLYEVLRHRGVHFKFFHKIEQVHYAAGGQIETISYAEQVQLAVPEYNPVKKL